ncbi:hypothetical protein [Kocuria sp. NPDC057446]|uniref:hypothetical protein n=1 Tax=Kocuria sp. NPDC057446 TaxID=3346137 RepID=UPI0036A45223
MRSRETHTTRKAAVSLLAAAGLALAGCGGGGEDEAGTEVDDITGGEVAETPDAEETPAAEGTPTRMPFYGAYDREFTDDQAVHEGQEVTLTAEIVEIVSGNALEIGDPDDITLDPLLVLHDLGATGLEQDQAVEVVGTVMASFELATAEEELGVDLEDELYTDYEGDPWLRATEVTPGEAAEG